MEITKKFLDILDNAQDDPALAARNDLMRVRKWIGLASLAAPQIESLFYHVLGGAEASPLDVFHPDIQKKLSGTNPASVTIYECIGTQAGVLQCLNDLTELRTAALALVQTRYSDLAEWDLMMSDDIGKQVQALGPPNAHCLSTAGAPVISLYPQEVCVYLLFA